MGQDGRSRADVGRFGTMYEEGVCLVTPALEHIERANRDASEARLARLSTAAHRDLVRTLVTAPIRLVRFVREFRLREST